MNLKYKRMSLNMTQEELANKLSVKRSTVAMWEAGESLPRSDKIPELAKILNCSTDDLFNGFGGTREAKSDKRKG